MSVKYGFYNSLNNDRVYEALDFSRIFNGIINDGIFSNIGTCFAVTASTGMKVNVGIGRAWFNGTWTYNDSILPLTIPSSELVLDRIDAVILEVNQESNARVNRIYVKTGTPGSSPKRPTMVRSEYVNQYPLAFITVRANVKTLTQASIENAVGLAEYGTPFVTGILKVLSIDAIKAQWEAQWNEWTTKEKADYLKWINDQHTDFEHWKNEEQTDFEHWKDEEQADFEDWFAHIKEILDDNVATKLQREIDELNDDLRDLPSGTLTAGQTSLTIRDTSITTTGLIDVYTDIYGENPTDISVTNGAITLTFSALSKNMNVKVRCL